MLCYLNGEFLPLSEARISPFDRGFLFGDAVYEVVPAYNRQPFYWRRHLARLRGSLQKIRLPFDVAQLEAPAKRLLAAAEFSDMALYIHITRGAPAKRGLPIAQGGAPTVFMTAWQIAPISHATHRSPRAVSCLLAEDIRWARCDIKSASLLGAALLAPAAEAPEEEVVIIRDGKLSEGSSGNFIVVKDGELRTPPVNERMLHGITYQVVLEVARALGLPTIARDISQSEVMAADELWLTSSVRGLLPVARVAGAAIGGGEIPGEIFRQTHAAWLAHIADSESWRDK